MTAHRRTFCLAGSLFVLAACAPAQDGDRSSSPPATGAAVASAAADRTATASSSGLPGSAGSTGEHVATQRYRIDISYPGLTPDDAPLADMLRKIAHAAKRDFLQSLPDPEQFPEFADQQFKLLIDFKLVARTPDFLSVRETGMQDSGGAHPMPIDSTVVFDTQAHRVIALDDLFADAGAARKAIADHARATLVKKIMAQAPKPGEGSPAAIREWKINAKQMIDDGTQPTAQNFANFIVRAGSAPAEAGPGLTLIFPPYQVAAYVYGTQTVDVPSADFARYLKPQYKDAFSGN